MIKHPIPPLYDKNSKILILGSFPSVKSRETAFFYGHPQNRFWTVLPMIFDDEIPKTVERKKQFALKHNIALWDVISSCDIQGSADSTIKNVQPNDLSVILKNADIKMIFANGKTAEKFYNKYTKPLIKRDICVLPSTSPANAAWNVSKLVESWSIVKDYVL